MMTSAPCCTILKKLVIKTQLQVKSGTSRNLHGQLPTQDGAAPGTQPGKSTQTLASGAIRFRQLMCPTLSLSHCLVAAATSVLSVLPSDRTCCTFVVLLVDYPAWIN